jgi:hypothetical protein
VTSLWKKTTDVAITTPNPTTSPSFASFGILRCEVEKMMGASSQLFPLASGNASFP